MANEKLQINIPVSGMKNATQRRTRRFCCCSCLGPKESMSDSAITVTLGKYDEYEYVVEKLAIKRIPTRLLAEEEIGPNKVEKNASDTTTTQSTQLEELGETSKKRPTGITFSSYYKMVPNKPSPNKIPQMRERTESSIITLSDSKNQPKNACDFNVECEASAINKHATVEKKYENDSDLTPYNPNTKAPIRELKKFHQNIVDSTVETDCDSVHNRNDGKYLELTDERLAVKIDPQTKKTLQILGGAPAGENIHRYYHNFAKGPVRCIAHDGNANKYINVGDSREEPINLNVKNKYGIDTDDLNASSALNDHSGLKWKILIKHHDKRKRNHPPPIESTTEAYSDSEY